MDTFLSVPAHFTDSPLISPRSRIDPWRGNVPTPPTNRNYEGKEKAGEGRRGRRIKDWPRVIIVRGRGRRAPRVIPVQGQTKIRLLELRV